MYVGFGLYLDLKDDRVGALVTEFSNLFHSVIVYGKKDLRYVFVLHKGTVKFCHVRILYLERSPTLAGNKSRR